jgi:hypothetical protein
MQQRHPLSVIKDTNPRACWAGLSGLGRSVCVGGGLNRPQKMPNHHPMTAPTTTPNDDDIDRPFNLNLELWNHDSTI